MFFVISFSSILYVSMCFHYINPHPSLCLKPTLKTEASLYPFVMNWQEILPCEVHQHHLLDGFCLHKRFSWSLQVCTMHFGGAVITL